MRLLHVISPLRLMHFVAGRETAGFADRQPALRGLNDHYLRDIGLRRERRTTRILYPWM